MSMTQVSESPVDVGAGAPPELLQAEPADPSSAVFARLKRLSRVQRIRRVLLVLSAMAILALCLFTDSAWRNAALVHDLIQTVGLVLTLGGALGRIWSSLYLNRRKKT